MRQRDTLEIIQGSAHAVFPMGDVSRVGEARRHAARLAGELAFGEVEAGRLALVVTELGTNLYKHAKAGRLLIASRTTRSGDSATDASEIEVLSIDEGPGIANLEQCMGDGFSTGGSPGTGLGAIRRLADEFAVHTAVPTGTVIAARVRASSKRREATGAFRMCAIALVAPGESVCGDSWLVAVEGDKAAVMVADGLGHGPDAAQASREAIRIFAKDPFASLDAMLEQSHATLRATRGAAVLAAHLDARESSIRSAGAGNVMMRIVSGVSDRTVLAQNGTVGVQVRKTQEVQHEWPRHAATVMFSDGIQSRWPAGAIAPVLGGDPGLAAALLVRDHCRGRDDATVVVLRRKEQA